MENEKNKTPQSCNIDSVSCSLSWNEKVKIANMRMAEMRANAVKTSVLFDIDDNVFRKLIIEGINIGVNYR